MRLARLLPILLTLAVASCATPESSDDAGGTGGSSSEGGNSGTGGKVGSTGGTTGTGGSATGGSTGTGGKVATGGTTGTGGTTATGGTTGTGGTTATGGTTGTGGTTATGGTTGTGGNVATGGTTGTGGKGGTTGTGGAPATGGTTGKAGASGTGGTPATGGTGGAASSAVCKFASGLNVAWVNFASDIPNPNLATFNTIFTNSAAVGGRVIRWWFHTNGTVTPGYDTNTGLALSLTSAAMNDVVSLANAAHTAGVALNISLWSFDMLQGPESGETIPAATLTNNQNLLTVDNNRNAYINNVLVKLVTALKGNPGVYSYEIFNEPEGMTTEHGWTAKSPDNGLSVPEAMIQKTVNWFASAIHTTDPSARVTTGSQTFDYCSNASGKTNYYSDAALRAAGGMQNGTLDFYEVHYYDSNGTSDSAFMYPASHWALDKNLVMGEFWAITTDGVNGADTYTSLYNNGYNGAWAWNYETNDDNGGNPMTAWPTMKTPMQNLYTAQMATLNACP
jgi:Cellulase (glycosyl hydrolase family 5)